jgi:predicted nucleic acid-binding protein
MKLTFVDSGVLIAAFRGTGREGRLALKILDDRERAFASSIFVRLETIPKPRFFKREMEFRFYEVFFDRVSKWATVDLDLMDSALEVAFSAGLSALDALNLAAAHQTECEEFMTTEKPTKPIHRTNLMAIKTIHL